MAVTITSEPPVLNASKRYIRITATSDRLASLQYTTITVDNNGGKCRYTLGAGHGILVDDVITPTAYDSYFCVRQTVTAKTATEITTNLDWPTSSTTVIGTVTRTNDNFKVRCRVYVDSALVATHFKQALSSVFTFFIENSVDAKITYNLPTTVTLLSPCANQYKDFYAVLDEYFDNEDGLSTLCSDAADTTTTVAAIKASRSDIQAMPIYDVYDMSHASGGRFLTNAPNNYTVRIYGKEIYPLCFFSSSITAITLNWTRYNSAMAVNATGSSNHTLTGKYGIVDLVNIIASTSDAYIRFHLSETSSGTRISEYFYVSIDRKCYNKRTGILFQNRLGGWDRFDFVYDFETYQDENKFEIKKKLDYEYTANSRSKETVYSNPVQSIKCKSHYIDYNTALWLMELKSSKQVFLYSGGAWLSLNKIEMEIPAIYDNSNLIQVEFKAELYNIV